jgi:CRP/FNR family cyclic AMP-dependent transcriptional regulator
MDANRLKSVPLFESLSDEERQAIAPFADEVVVSDGKVLVEEGDFSYQFMMIVEGTAKVDRGGEHVAELGAGDFFGEIGLIEKELRTATVTATSDMRLITLTSWDLKRLEKTAPSAFEQIRQTVEERRPG